MTRMMGGKLPRSPKTEHQTLEESLFKTTRSSGVRSLGKERRKFDKHRKRPYTKRTFGD
jgi:hypothetical protein